MRRFKTFYRQSAVRKTHLLDGVSIGYVLMMGAGGVMHGACHSRFDLGMRTLGPRPTFN